MNYVSPRLEAAAASTRKPEDVMAKRLSDEEVQLRMMEHTAKCMDMVTALFEPQPAPQFGSIARVKFDERELFARVQKAITELELALGSAAEFSDLMPDTYASTLQSLKDMIHDECCTASMLDSLMEGEA